MTSSTGTGRSAETRDPIRSHAGPQLSGSSPPGAEKRNPPSSARCSPEACSIERYIVRSGGAPSSPRNSTVGLPAMSSSNRMRAAATADDSLERLTSSFLRMGVSAKTWSQMALSFLLRSPRVANSNRAP